MNQKNERIEEIAKNLRDLYAAGGGYHNASEIFQWWTRLDEAMAQPTLEDALYVLQTISCNRAVNCRRLAVKMVARCGSFAEIKTLLPHFPKANKTYQPILLRKLIELANDKTGLLLDLSIVMR